MAGARPRKHHGVGGKGMLGSLAIHLCAGVIAFAIVLNKPGSGDLGDTGTTGGGTDFVMSPSPQVEPSIPQTVKLQAPVARPLLAYPELHSTINLPPVTPMQLISATPQIPSATETTSTSSASAAKGSAGKSNSKKSSETGSGSGRGQMAKRAKPSPPPKLLQAPPPRYPAKAKADKITGKAAVLIQVRANGAAGSTSLYRSSGNGELDQAAVIAARSWKFSPTPSLGDGETIPVIVHVTFSL